MFVPDMSFQPNIMFANKARAYRSEASFRCSSLGLAPDLIHKHYNRLERPARDAMTFSITTISIMTIRTKGLFVTFSIMALDIEC